jgi:hypothetical protein
LFTAIRISFTAAHFSSQQKLDEKDDRLHFDIGHYICKGYNTKINGNTVKSMKWIIAVSGK